MTSFFCTTVRFLNSCYHGRGDGGAPEWPPSPLRLFQAIVAAAAARSRDGVFPGDAESALHWLEAQPPPTIVAPHVTNGTKYRLYVPDNVADKVGAAWSRGNEASIADYRTEKDVLSMHLRSDEAAVHFLWSLANLSPEVEEHTDSLSVMARSITHLGWGIDMVVANAKMLSQAEAESLVGHRWDPVRIGSTSLRIAIAGTLDALRQRYDCFLRRLPTPDTFHPVPALTAFKTTGYFSQTIPDTVPPPGKPFAAFSILKPDASRFHAFDKNRGTVAVAGMLRHATAVAAQVSWQDSEKVNRFVLGHGEQHGEAHRPVGLKRFAYLPLPSLEARNGSSARTVSAIRRVLIADLSGNCDDEIAWARRSLSGGELFPDVTERTDHNARGEGQSQAILSLLPNTDRGVVPFVKPSANWGTVTPVVLPGYDDPNHYRRRLKQNSGTLGAKEKKCLLQQLDDRIDNLLRKAIVQAGFSETLARDVELDWGKVGFLAGVDLASRHSVPEKLRRFPRLHVKLRWRDPEGQPLLVPGPICIGGGKFCGLGLFVAT